MIPYDDALDLILSRTAYDDPEVENVLLAGAPGRFIGREVRSRVALPPFPNSAMDGFALATGGRTVPSGTRFEVAGRIAAGDAPLEAGGAQGRAWEIMTGAPVPTGLDAVVPVERVHVERVHPAEDGAGSGREQEQGMGLIVLDGEVEPGDNVRPAGKDFTPGDLVLETGRRVDAAELMALAALGVARVPVFPRVRGAVFCTGPELVDDPAAPLEPGRIRNSNGPYLTRVLEAQGVELVAVRTLGDEVDPFVDQVERVVEAGARLVVSTGAVSMGRHDFVPGALDELGATLLFHRAAIRPGKPILAAVLPGGALYFGLPGNPMSAAVGFRFFVLPWLRSLRGLGRKAPWRLPLAETVSKRPDLRYFTRAEVVEGQDGLPRARVLPAQQSFRIAPFLAADGWAVLPEGMDEVEAGILVDVHGLHGESLGSC